MNTISLNKINYIMYRVQLVQKLCKYDAKVYHLNQKTTKLNIDGICCVDAILVLLRSYMPIDNLMLARQVWLIYAEIQTGYGGYMPDREMRQYAESTNGMDMVLWLQVAAAAWMEIKESF